MSPRQFYGIDKNPFGVELAKVTLVLGKELALKEPQRSFTHLVAREMRALQNPHDDR